MKRNCRDQEEERNSDFQIGNLMLHVAIARNPCEWLCEGATVAQVRTDNSERTAEDGRVRDRDDTLERQRKTRG